MDSACPKAPTMHIFLTKSVTWNFAKKLPTLGTHYKATPDPEPTVPEGLLPDLPDPTRGIDTSLYDIYLNKQDENQRGVIYHRLVGYKIM